MSTPAGIGASGQSSVGHTEGAWHTARAVRRPLAALLVLVAAALASCSDEAGEAADGGSAAGTSSFCEAAEALDERIGELDAAFDDGDRPPAEVLGDVEAELERLAETAPAGAADDLEVMAGAVRRLAGAIADIDLEEPGALEAVAGDLAAIDEELDASADRVGATLERECGVDIGDAEE